MIAGATVALTAGLGARRAASGPSGLALGLGLLLASAGACYTIAQTKTGGFLPGIIGALLALLMLTAAGGLVLGALARWLWAALRRTPPMPVPARNWDLWLLGALSALAVVLSVME